MGGSPCISGHRIRVADVVRRWAMHEGDRQMAEVLAGYPGVSQEQIEAALAYYGAHKDEIDAYIAEEEAIYKKELEEQRRRST